MKLSRSSSVARGLARGFVGANAANREQARGLHRGISDTAISTLYQNPRYKPVIED